MFFCEYCEISKNNLSTNICKREVTNKKENVLMDLSNIFFAARAGFVFFFFFFFFWMCCNSKKVTESFKLFQIIYFLKVLSFPCKENMIPLVFHQVCCLKSNVASDCYFNPCWPNAPFLYPLKTSENLSFSDILS